MRAQRSPANRRADIFLLAIVVSIALALSALPAFARTQATPVSPSRVFVPGCTLSGLTVLPASATSHLKGRNFAEETTSSSSEVMKAARLECMMESPRTPYPVPPALQNIFGSVSNRQRAP